MYLLKLGFRGKEVPLLSTLNTNLEATSRRREKAFPLFLGVNRSFALTLHRTSINLDHLCFSKEDIVLSFT